jgi:general secretion pathway protein G
MKNRVRSLGRGSGRVGAAGAGFTLIEVMIVIAIILALSGLVGVAVFAQRDSAKKDTAKVELNTIKRGLEMFRLDFDRWPKDEEGLAVLWDKSKLDPESDATKWKQYLTDPMPNDRWGHAWGYKQVSEHQSDDTKYDLWSNGPDGQEGTDDDITSWSTAGAEGGTGSTAEAPPPSTPKTSPR